MQKKINDTIAKNKELYEINPPVSKISLRYEYVSYCLDVSVFLVYLIWDIKDIFLLFRFALLITHSLTSLYVCAQMSLLGRLTLTILFKSCSSPINF